MKKEFTYVSGIQIIPFNEVLELHLVSHDHILLRAISNNKIRGFPIQAGSAKWSVQERKTKSGVEYAANFSASIKVDGQQNGEAWLIMEPALVILDFCDQPSRLIGTQSLPVYVESYIDEYKHTIDFNHSSFQYPPTVTIIE